MPDQREPQAQAPAPVAQAPAQPPAQPTSNQSQNQTPQGKKSNVAVIIIVVILILLVLFGVGGYLAYRYAKNKVTTALNTSSTTSTTGTTGTDSATNTANSVADTYNSAKDTTPTSGVGIEDYSEIKTIISGVFGGAKLSSWMDLGNASSLTYTLKRLSVASDYTTLESAFIAKGWTKTANYTTDSDFSVYFTKGNIAIIVGGTFGYQEVSVSVTASE